MQRHLARVMREFQRGVNEKPAVKRDGKLPAKRGGRTAASA
jgi:hypothetical protein